MTATVPGVTEPLPVFPYHPDPLATGSIAPSTTACVCCGRSRGYIYRGPVYAVAELRELLCPWCLADGCAADKFEAHFIGDPIGDDVPLEVVLSVDARTPGFSTWQDPRWFFHCGDGAAFLGAVGASELAAFPDAVDALRKEAVAWGWSADEVEHHLGALDTDGAPTAYLFQCRTCATHLAYADFT
ncbi:CbrC family protein [Streptomyces sp. NBC_01800]|uniref:CbrC family protein n=1 Tax=Streptomyces sp. NBC_01800 TaxID=2975945 RepID=UPI002DDAC36F|nr:CbrC family protein [Streptomyces sp. NBC_01800]WSA68870.1 CbrC family protein [Streptomyces sp. NBC_01800]